MGKRRMAAVHVDQNPRIRAGASLAYIMFESLREGEDGELRLIVRGVAYEPECGAPGHRLPSVIENGAPANA